MVEAPCRGGSLAPSRGGRTLAPAKAALHRRDREAIVGRCPTQVGCECAHVLRQRRTFGAISPVCADENSKSSHFHRSNTIVPRGSRSAQRRNSHGNTHTTWSRSRRGPQDDRSRTQRGTRGRGVPDHQPGPADQRRPELAQGGRTWPVAARGFPAPREDHPLRSRAHPRARRACARGRGARRVPRLQVAGGAHARKVPAGSCRGNAGVRSLFDGGRFARLIGPRARRARFRRQVLYRGGQLRPRRQQHPGVLHPGRDQVSGPDPCGEARAAQRDSAGGVRARHVLGLRFADARIDAHDHVGDVRSGDPAQPADDGRVRHPHVPTDQ